MDKQFKLGPWVVNPSHCTICNEQQGSRKIEPKAMQLLVTLARAEGQLVLRNDIFQALWGNQEVTDYALNTLVASLRKNLGGGDNGSQLIETRPKLGYKLAVAVTWLNQENSKTSSGAENSQANKPRQSPLLKYLTIVIILLLSTLGYFLFDNYRANKETITLYENSLKNSSIQERKLNNQVIKYTVKIAVSYSLVELDQTGMPYCTDFNFEMLSKAIYSNKHWKLVGNTVTYNFDHTGTEFTNINETHQIEYINFVGAREVDITNMVVDEIGELSGSSIITVYDTNDRVICKAKSLFIGSKI